jgi:hypothetical protein
MKTDMAKVFPLDIFKGKSITSTVSPSLTRGPYQGT